MAGRYDFGDGLQSVADVLRAYKALVLSSAPPSVVVHRKNVLDTSEVVERDALNKFRECFLPQSVRSVALDMGDVILTLTDAPDFDRHSAHWKSRGYDVLSCDGELYVMKSGEEVLRVSGRDLVINQHNLSKVIKDSEGL